MTLFSFRWFGVMLREKLVSCPLTIGYVSLFLELDMRSSALETLCSLENNQSCGRILRTTWVEEI